MDIKKAVFVTSLAAYGAFPQKGLPQIAVAGKSNVGKSTLINGLCRQKGLAKTSGTPGKTRLINVFLLNDQLHLIDLPGYGYAKVGQKEKERWGEMMQRYFDTAGELKVMLQLVDIRHAPTQDDMNMIAFLRTKSLPFIVVATKADKLSKAQRTNALMLIARELQVQPWEIIVWSGETKEGRDKILQALEAYV